MVTSVDSNEANLLEILQEDLEDFFFGVRVVIETEAENTANYKHIAPIKTVKYRSKMDVNRVDEDTREVKSVPVEYKFKMRIYKNQSDSTQCPVCRK